MSAMSGLRMTIRRELSGLIVSIVFAAVCAGGLVGCAAMLARMQAESIERRDVMVILDEDTGDVAAHHREQGSSKKQIVRDLGIRYGSGRDEQSGAGARLRR